MADQDEKVLQQLRSIDDRLAHLSVDIATAIQGSPTEIEKKLTDRPTRGELEERLAGIASWEHVAAQRVVEEAESKVDKWIRRWIVLGIAVIAVAGVFGYKTYTDFERDLEKVVSDGESRLDRSLNEAVEKFQKESQGALMEIDQASKQMDTFNNDMEKASAQAEDMLTKMAIMVEEMARNLREMDTSAEIPESATGDL